jgi:23S rRNA (guanosine2251-2'-O)-methyltransferase
MQNKKNQNQKRNTSKSANQNSRHFKSDGNSQDIWLCGKHPTFTIIQKKRRKIFEILATQNSISELEDFLKKNSFTSLRALVKIADNQKIENLVGRNQVHQGLAVRCSKLPIKNQNDLLEELYTLNSEENFPKLLLIDQISDPHNAGAIIRSAAAFGVKKIIFSEHNSAKESPTMVKSSAGMIDHVDIFYVTNFSNLLEKLKKLDYWCIGLAGEAKTLITEIKGYKNIALIIGSEGDGIRDLVKKNCDILARIEIEKNVESLNASVAAAISLYELSK